MIGKTFGPYQVLAKLGEGGMGEVYRASDTSLNRDAALKVLPEGVAHDPDRLMRFRREAEALAALNHPNVAQVYGIVEVGQDRPAIAMEFVDGQTLEELLVAAGAAGGGMPLDEVIPIARQIASALEAAHESGIVHRDLKPANIKVKPDGTVKVLDFGLAKALDPTASGTMAGSSRTSVTESPTMTSPALTAMGLILGTAAYMSPEQAKGRQVDRRADIWAFGVVLYEMLTGRRMFEGETVTEVIAAVLRADIPLEGLPADCPSAIRRLMSRCLDRDPKTRLRDIGEARITLEYPGEAEAPVAAQPVAPGRNRWVTLLIVLASLTALVAIVYLGVSPDAVTPERVAFTLFEGQANDVAVTRDGRRVAFSTGYGQDLWVRDLDSPDPRKLVTVKELTSVAAPGVFWSWDGTQLGYAAEGALWRVPAEGGTPIQICRLENESITGAAWGPDDRIVFGSWRGGLYEVAAGGATAPRQILEAGNGVEDFHAPLFLPNGMLAYTPHFIEPREWEFHVRNGADTKVLTGLGGGAYVQGHIVYSRTLSRSGANPGLWARPFDLDRLEFTGEPTLILPDVTEFAAAATGTLVYNTGLVEDAVALSRLGWRNRDGSFTPLTGEPRAYTSGALSPDKTTIAAFVLERDGGSLVLVDVAKGSVTPLLPANEYWRRSPRWSSDGRFIFFSEQRGFVHHIVVVAADGRSQPRDVIEGQAAAPVPGGGALVFERDQRGSSSLWIVDLDDNQPTGDARLLRGGAASLEHPAVSPDGTLVAFAQGPATGYRYSTDYNVFVTSLPDGSGLWPVSVGGGNMPTWDSNTGNLVYLTETSVMTVPVSAGVPPQIGRPRVLMPFPDAQWMANFWRPRLGLSKDATAYMTFAHAEPDDPAPPDRLVLVRPWFPQTN